MSIENNFISAKDALAEFNEGHYVKAGMMAVGLVAITICMARTVKAGVAGLLKETPTAPSASENTSTQSPAPQQSEQVPVILAHKKLGPNDLETVIMVAETDIKTSQQLDDEDVRAEAARLQRHFNPPKTDAVN